MKGQHRDLVTYHTCLRHFGKDVTLRGLCCLLISIAHNLNLHVHFSLVQIEEGTSIGEYKLKLELLISFVAMAISPAEWVLE
jgi:hypothetical protein